MAYVCLRACLVIIFVTFVRGQGATCPICTNKYDYTSCTLTQSCGTGSDFCEVVVHTSDFYSLEYVCSDMLTCINLANPGCSPEVNETCFYCCNDEVSCQIQRDDLYNFEFPHSGLITATPISATSTTAAPGSASTAAPGSVSTAAPGSASTAAPGSASTEVPAGGSVMCPACSDAYSHESCTGTLSCSPDVDTVCQVTVHTSDNMRLEYQCGHYQSCVDQESPGCHPSVNDTCTYCCSELVSCQIQRDDLFKYELPSLVANITTPATDATTESANTTSHTASPSAASSPPPTATTPPDEAIRCLQCGDFSKHIPCTPIELVLNQPMPCPDSLPYCFTSFTQNETNVVGYKGCATANFCSLEYELASSKAECTNPDFTVPAHVSCGYCCNTNACNSVLRPDNSSIVAFP